MSSSKKKMQVMHKQRRFANTSIFVAPATVSLIMVYILYRAVALTSPRYGTRSCLLAVLVSIIWVGLFFFHQRKIEKGESDILLIRCRLIIVLIIVFFIGVFLAFVAWNAGYVSLVPYERIDNGAQHIDTMFHSSIAESWRRSLYPSTLLNDERYIAYHTFSHLLLGAVSGIMRMPALVVYCYLYPILFLPLHCFSALLAVLFSKGYFENKMEVQFLDLIVIGLYIFGVTDNIEAYGIWKSSFFISESFLIANTFSFFAYAFSFYALKQWKDNKRLMIIHSVVIVPIEILIISWSKVSVGFIFTASIMYYVFRSHIKDIRVWILDVLYLLEFIVCLRIFNNGGDMSRTIPSKFKWFAYEDYISGGLGMWGHYIVLSLMTMLFIVLELYKNRYKWRDVKIGKTVWIEDILIVSMLAFLPATIMNIRSASVYFSFAIEIPSLVLLCGHNYINVEEDAKGLIKPLIYVVSFCWCIWMGYHNKPGNPLSTITNEHTSNLSQILLDIRDTVGKNPEDYIIYLDTDSVLSQIFTSDKTAVFVCPSMTGVGVINATYEQDGTRYCYMGTPVDEGYSLDKVDNGYLSFEDAVMTAKERGKEHIIHMTNVGYEVVDLN